MDQQRYLTAIGQVQAAAKIAEDENLDLSVKENMEIIEASATITKYLRRAALSQQKGKP